MKILITGSTASQYSSKSDSRIPTFAGLLCHSLVEKGYSVTWTKPNFSHSKEWLDQFDKIIVGISSPSSLSANKIYGALSVIDYAKELEKLVLFIDAPEPYKVWSGIRAISKNSKELLKSFYINRYDYKEATDSNNFNRLLKTVDYLYNNKWPLTLYPSNPWINQRIISKNIPNLTTENLYGICFDSFILQDLKREKPNGGSYWVVDQPNTVWSKTVSKTLNKEILPIKENKWSDMSSILAKIDDSIGVLISPYKNIEPWWSIIISHSLLLEVPVVTEWRNTINLGKEWAMLASQVEDMSPNERNSLAKTQRSIYSSLLLSSEEVIKSIEKNVLSTRYLKV